ncbi:hypothetical protein [uncultured Arthrobacter sp.]|uniref:hypothetical protein n=1 Tax=uncultured Arthrobacter sp. TaxID=114050 RepID=UPI003217C3F3
MIRRTKAIAGSLALTLMLGLGAAAASGSALTGAAAQKETRQVQPASAQPVSNDPDHPECYDDTRLADPNDFCYQTIGPWNSVRSSDDEVRSLMPVERMIAAGKTVSEIQRYYPDYTPKAG